MHEQPPQPSFMERMRSQINILVFVASIFAVFGEITFLRRRFGERYLRGWNVPLVIPLLLFFPIFWPTESPGPVMLCFVAFIFMSLVHRIAGVRRRMRGETGVHSMYNGQSRLERLFPNASEADLKTKHEPIALIALGMAAGSVSSPLGWLFIWTGVASGFHAHMLFEHFRHRELDLADARIEGQQLMGTPRRPDPMSDAVVQIHRRNA